MAARKKRGSGEGTIFQRKDLLWVASISLGRDPATGKPLRRTAYARTRKEAAEKLQALQQEAAGGLPTARKDITVEALMLEWLGHMEPSWRQRTYDSAESCSRIHIVPALGKVKLPELTGHRIQLWLRSMGAVRVASLSRTYLRSACELAMRWGWIARNPVDMTDALPVKRRAHPDISIEIAQKLLAVNEGTADYPIVCLLLGCGLRISECLGLRWSDFDAAAGVLRVAGQITTAGTLQPPKTRSGNRVISVPSWAAEALGGVERVENDLGLIWPGVRREALNRRVGGRQRSAGIEGVRLHDLRHAYASLLIDAGVPITGVSAALGHSSPAITMSVYAHKMHGVDVRPAAAMEALRKKKDAG